MMWGKLLVKIVATWAVTIALLLVSGMFIDMAGKSRLREEFYFVALIITMIGVVVLMVSWLVSLWIT